MNTVLFLGLSAILGILTHNLMKIDKLNRSSQGFSLWQFIKLEWASIGVSICVVGAALIGREAIADLQHIGKWLALGFWAIGLSSQSIAYWALNRSEIEIKKRLQPPGDQLQP